MFEDDRALGETFTPDQIGWIDFETAGPDDLKVVGATRYATSANAILLAYAIGDGPPQLVEAPWGRTLHWADMPRDLREHHRRTAGGDGIWAAFNAGFDRAIWNYAAFDFHLMEAHQIIDVSAQATAAGLPPDLSMAAKMCGGDAFKLDTGRALIDLFCKPDAVGTPRTHPLEWEAFRDYARHDIESMRSVFRHTRQLALAEWSEYWAMENINARGARIDLDMVQHAARLAVEDRRRSSDELYTMTAGQVTTPDQIKRMIELLLTLLPDDGQAILTKRQEEIDDEGEIVRPPKFSLTRRRVQLLLAYCRSLLDDPELLLPQRRALELAERVLQIRLFGGSRTPAKFGKMLHQQVDGVLYGQYVFNGAPQTGRASSRGVQVHNLARDTLPYEYDAIAAILRGCSYGELATLGDPTPVSRKLSLLIRPSFIPDSGNVFVWSDWSQIEARILPWLAGESRGAIERLNIFRAVDRDPDLPDLYTRTAATLSHCAVQDVDKAMRQRGKVAELALGFGGGVGALQAMAANYGMYIDADEASATVTRWREANRWCVQFWGVHHDETSVGLWGAIHRAMQAPRTPHVAGRIGYVFLDDYLGGSLLCILPSGRILTYRKLKYERTEDLDEDDNVIGYSTKLRFARGHGRVNFWHGMAAENVVQAVAADFLRGTLRRLEDEHHDVRLHTHDEILLEVREALAPDTVAALREIMLRGFSWSNGLPLQSEETTAHYYTKTGG